VGDLEEERGENSKSEDKALQLVVSLDSISGNADFVSLK
jgi:hypothetical protein